ncbi:hypothetical protein KGV31_002136 [Vibrio parahaemolyticus]|nr:hypothetical protein [Vibrio parahaemolyticus]EHU0344280.1 hypothetical protein [Vibrio parahaemolyticus]EHU0354314.1 hypothetical protein [Vibrio parahaemolyticus]
MATLFEQHQELINILGSKVSIRKLFTDLHPEDIEKLINRQSEVLKEIYAKIEEEKAALKEKEAAVEKAKAALAELGLTVEDLVAQESIELPAKIKRTRKSPEKVHFVYINKDGYVEHLHRPNSGRFPEDFKAYCEAQDIERDALIVTEEQALQAVKNNKLPTVKTFTEELEDRIEDVEDEHEDDNIGNK